MTKDDLDRLEEMEMDNKELLERFVELAPKEWGVRPGVSATEGFFINVKPSGYTVTKIRNGLCVAARIGVLYFDLNDDRASAESAFFLWDYLEGKGWMPSISSTEDGPTLEMVTTGEANEFEYVTWNLGHSKNRIESLVRACVAYWESTGKQEGE